MQLADGLKCIEPRLQQCMTTQLVWCRTNVLRPVLVSDVDTAEVRVLLPPLPPLLFAVSGVLPAVCVWQLSPSHQSSSSCMWHSQHSHC
jgi:hypothetical protein